MNVLRLLMAQHDRVEGLLEKFDRLYVTREWTVLREEFSKQVRRHFELEEAFFYTEVRPRLVLVSAERFLEEHKQINELVKAFEDAQDEVSARSAVRALQRAFVQHAGDEEIELFPEVKRRFDSDELEAMGDRLQAQSGEFFSHQEREETKGLAGVPGEVSHDPSSEN